MAKEKPFNIAPPKIYIENNANNVVTEVINVLDNVWFIIWPNQKKALGIVEVTPEEKAKSAKTAMLTSRINTLLSLPMLLSMVMAQNLY